jgi:hypothetical protein
MPNGNNSRAFQVGRVLRRHRVVPNDQAVRCLAYCDDGTALQRACYFFTRDARKTRHCGHKLIDTILGRCAIVASQSPGRLHCRRCESAAGSRGGGPNDQNSRCDRSRSVANEFLICSVLLRSGKTSCGYLWIYRREAARDDTLYPRRS